MSRGSIIGLVGLIAALQSAPTLAQQMPADHPAADARALPDTSSPAAKPPASPADTVSDHLLDLPGRSLHLTATAGFVRISAEDGAAEADIGMTAYTVAGADPVTRPVTFVINGGPGMASAWLQMGAVGPWRMPMVPGPSASPVPVPNAETWLDFTDLVFIDPVGTGYSHFVATTDDVRKRLWSVDGDIDGVAQAIRRWLDTKGRITSPKFLLGESYGGFRAPLLARRLAEREGVGLRGLVIVSPVLDFGNRSAALDVIAGAAALPSMAAVVLSDKGQPVARADLADAERYAGGVFIADVLRGPADPAALGRVVEKVSALTGLDPALVRQHRGLIDAGTFDHEHDRETGRLASSYDATVSLPDPFPEATGEGTADPVLDGLNAPITAAVLAVYDRLHWHPEGRRYRLFNPQAARQWDFGHGYYKPQALEALRQALALDPRFHVIVAHGLFDLVTPYYGTQILLNQIQPAAGGDRVTFLALPGGHMFYSRDDSRQAFRAAAARLIGGTSP